MNPNNYIKKGYIKTTIPAKYAISKIVFQYRMILGDRNHPISLRKLSNELNIILNPIGGNVSHQSIKNWEDKKHLPNVYWMIQLLINAKSSWCKDFSQDILSIIQPEKYKPASMIGKNILIESDSKTLYLSHNETFIPSFAT